MLNLYPDPALTDTGYLITGSAITKSAGQISFNGAGNLDAIAMDGAAVEVPFFDVIAVGGQYKVSLNAANVTPGTLMVKIGAGAWAYITLSADGWTTPVTVTAGSNRFASFTLKGTNGTTLDIIPDANGEAIRITT